MEAVRMMFSVVGAVSPIASKTIVVRMFIKALGYAAWVLSASGLMIV
jgi:hypothetical protein